MTADCSRKLSNKTDEELKLEEELSALADAKKAVFENTREFDRELLKIRQREQEIRSRLQRLKEQQFEAEGRERYGELLNRLENEAREAKAENAQLKELIVKYKRMLDDKAASPSESQLSNHRCVDSRKLEATVHALHDSIRSLTSYSRAQQREKERLASEVDHLKDKLAVERQLATETQLRQLRELQSSTDETNEMIRTLVVERHQRMQTSLQQHTTGSGYATLQRYYRSASETLDAQSVARVMFQLNALTLKELQSIQSKRQTPVEAAECLLNIVLSQTRTVYECFLDVLKVGHRQLYEFVVSGSYDGYSKLFAHTSLIRDHYVNLVETLDVKLSGLISELYQAGVVSQVEMEAISAEKTSFSQNEQLLAVLSRKSTEQWDKFLTALGSTGQGHVRDRITGRQGSEETRSETHTQEAVQSMTIQQLLEQQLEEANATIERLLQHLGQTTSVSTDLETDTANPAITDENSVHLVKRMLVARGQSVYGVTTLDGKIYVVCKESPRIVVYSADEPFLRLADIVVNKLKLPSGIAAANNCLYLADPQSNAVWRYRPYDGKLDKWMSDLAVINVSVTADGRLVLLNMIDLQGSAAKRNITYRGEVNLLTTTAVIQSVTALPSDIICPYHAVFTANTTLIVSHGRSYTETNRVCEVDLSGRTLKVFGAGPGGGFQQLNWPMHLSLADEGLVLVADGRNRRVLLLNRQLLLERVLLTWSRGSDAVAWPGRLHYDAQSATLLVGLYTGHLDIYKLHLTQLLP